MIQPQTAYFICLDRFFESGYNSVPWVERSNQEQQYYWEPQPCEKSQDFDQELTTSLSELFKIYPQINIINDESVYFYAIFARLRNLGPLKVSSLANRPPPDSFVDMCRDNQVYQKKAQLFLWKSQSEKGLTIWPQAYARILNASYQRASATEYGAPYWVYLENERVHHIGKLASKLNIHIVENVLKLKSSLFRAYLLSPELLPTWESQSFPEAHNDRIERIFWQKRASEGADLYHSLAPAIHESAPANYRFQSLSFPFRSFLKKYFSFHLKANALERIYGNAE